MVFGSLRFLRRSRAVEVAPSPAALDAASRLAAWGWLDDAAREQLVDDTDTLLGTWRWEAARGFELTDQACAMVAADVALLTLGIGLDCYREVGSVIIHASAIESRGEHSVGGGLVTDDPVDLSGQAHHRGPVLIVWDTARYEARHPEHGRNVILHEFAHHLDMLDGWVDGTPPLPSAAARARWIDVCTDAYERLRDGDTAGGVLDGYGATDPGEFFAVATEVFFARSAALRSNRPDLYEVLADFYRQDPARAQTGD